MKIESRRKLLKENLTIGIKRYLVINLILFILLALVRVGEYFYLSQVLTLGKGDYLIVLLGFLRDILMMLNFAAIFLIPFLILHIIFKPLANIVSALLIIFFVLAEMVLIKYYATTSLLLGADLFGYTFKEVMEISSAGGGLSVVTILMVLLFISIVVALFIFSKYIKPNIYIALAFISLSVISLFFNKYITPDSKKFDSEQQYNLSTNKAFHLFRESYYYFFPKEKTEVNLFTYFYAQAALSLGSSFEYISEDFPFLRKDNTPDVLGKYIAPGTKNPNIVIIIVESLARAYSGEGAYLGSFTPFLDSLASKSLYWENGLSTAGRTFEVLPSILGSMPYGKTGFAEMGATMPDGMTLVNLLKKRGYDSRFFYGSDSKFDNMRMFLEKQNIDQVIDEKDFGKGYEKMPANGTFTWGYGDKEIFMKGFEVLAKVDSTPRLDIYLTMAMHDPYLILNQKYYIQKAEEKFTEFKFSESKKAEYRNYIKNFSTVLYFDDAIRYFFKEYEKREDFKNTIFVITGDHRMSSPPISTQIDRFHVPIIVYSPMQKASQKFSSVVSHLDITPSIVAFLKNNYDMRFSDNAPWLGRGLDSALYFRNSMSMPFIRTKSETIDYLDNEYFISKDQLYIVSDNFALTETENPQKLSEIQRKFEKFKTDNLKATQNNRLIPDTLKNYLR